jgi:hypothetical protein
VETLEKLMVCTAAGLFGDDPTAGTYIETGEQVCTGAVDPGGVEYSQMMGERYGSGIKR